MNIIRDDSWVQELVRESFAAGVRSGWLNPITLSDPMIEADKRGQEWVDRLVNAAQASAQTLITQEVKG